MVGAYGGWVSWWVAKQSKQMHCLAMDGHSQTILGANKKDYIISLLQVMGGTLTVNLLADLLRMAFFNLP